MGAEGSGGAVVELEGLRKTYRVGKVEVEAVRGVSVKIGAGEFVAVAGPSGSGKTTLMNMIGLIDRPSGGRLVIAGREVGEMDEGTLTRLRREEIGFVFQTFNLLPVLTVAENVELPLTIGRGGPGRAERRERVEYLLKEVGLWERRGHKPGELSGGQQQRAAIARALVKGPRVVIADEPTANLDSANGARVVELMKRINGEEGTTFIFSTHDPAIWENANHVLFMRDGLVEREEER